MIQTDGCIQNCNQLTFTGIRSFCKNNLCHEYEGDSQKVRERHLPIKSVFDFRYINTK